MAEQLAEPVYAKYSTPMTFRSPCEEIDLASVHAFPSPSHSLPAQAEKTAKPNPPSATLI